MPSIVSRVVFRVTPRTRAHRILHVLFLLVSLCWIGFTTIVIPEQRHRSEEDDFERQLRDCVSRHIPGINSGSANTRQVEMQCAQETVSVQLLYESEHSHSFHPEPNSPSWILTLTIAPLVFLYALTTALVTLCRRILSRRPEPNHSPS